jgi:hypothetical protein
VEEAKSAVFKPLAAPELPREDASPYGLGHRRGNRDLFTSPVRPDTLGTSESRELLDVMGVCSHAPRLPRRTPLGQPARPRLQLFAVRTARSAVRYEINVDIHHRLGNRHDGQPIGEDDS